LASLGYKARIKIAAFHLRNNRHRRKCPIYYPLPPFWKILNLSMLLFFFDAKGKNSEKDKNKPAILM